MSIGSSRATFLIMDAERLRLLLLLLLLFVGWGRVDGVGIAL